nr:hypothetical protein BaRGS_009868 [Batillaria attramentaria]
MSVSASSQFPKGNPLNFQSEPPKLTGPGLVTSLKASSRSCFTLYERAANPICRYRSTDEIHVGSAELFLGKWCFSVSQEKDLMHQDQAATHLVFLQAQHDVQTGKFDLQEEDKQKLDECLEPGFTAEDQYILLCQKQPYYQCLRLPQCRLLQGISVSNCSLKTDSMLDVVVSKYGVKLVTDKPVIFTWYEVSKWVLNKEDTTVTFTYAPEDNAVHADVPLKTDQAELFLAGILEMIRLLQKEDKSGASFHADMITVSPDGSSVWENGLYNPSKASIVRHKIP